LRIIVEKCKILLHLKLFIKIIYYMVILHTETCKKKEKLEKNYLHLYLTIFLNNFLMMTSERPPLRVNKTKNKNIQD